MVLHFFTITLPRDFPGRDPTQFMAEITSDSDETFYEIHNSQTSSQVPKRLSTEKFELDEVRLVSKVKLIFLKNRQSNKKFWGPDDDSVNKIHLS